MGKKLLSILLTVAMLLSMVPVSYAEDDVTIVEEPLEADDIVIVEEEAAEPAPASAESEGDNDSRFVADPVQRYITIACYETATMAVDVQVENPDELSYEWYQYVPVTHEEDGNSWSNWSYVVIDGADGPSYTTEPLSRSRRFECRVKALNGESDSVSFEVYVDYTSVIAELARPIALDEEATAVIDGYEIGFFSFVPEEDGEYFLTSYSDQDTYAQLYDASFHQIDSEAYGGGGGNFRLQHDLIAGETYYYGVQFYSSDGLGSIPVVLTIGNNLQVSAEQEEQYVAPNERATMKVNVTARDTSKLTFTWLDNEGNVIEGETSDTFVSEPITWTSYFSCYVEDGYGNQRSVYFYVYVDSHFTANPVENEVYVSSGETATLEVAADSIDPDKITYRWRERREVTYGEGDDTWTDWEWSDIEGVTGNRFTTPPITENTSYICNVSDGYGRTYQLWFDVRINNHFTAEAVQSNFKVKLNETPTLEVRADSDDPDKITYQWYVSRRIYNEYGGWYNRNEIIDGATGSSLVAEPVTGAIGYYCQVSDGCGGEKNIWFSIEVETNFSAKAVQQDVSVSPETCAVLQVEASSDYPDKITYQWYARGTRLEGETSSSLTTDPISEYSDFYCYVTDGFGQSQEVWFYVRVETHFNARAVQESFYVEPEGTALLEVQATSDYPSAITYQWRVYREAPFGEGDNVWTEWTWVDIDGATDSSFTTDPITEYTRYRCRVSDGYGIYWEIDFYVYIQNHFSAEAEDSSPKVPLNEPAVLKVIATSDNPDLITYQWVAHVKHYNDDGGYWTEWVDVDGATGSSFVTDPVKERTEYHCRVSDGFGASENVWFYVSVDTHFTAEAEIAEQWVKLNETAALQVNADSDSPELITYQWYALERHYNESGNSWWNTQHIIEGATDSVYVTDPMTKSTEYYCRVNDGYGTEEGVWFYVHIDTNFSAEAVQESVSVPYNEPAGLEVRADSDSPELITYQWYAVKRHYYDATGNSWWSEDVRIEGATNSVYVTDPITERTDYYCMVNDGFGTAMRIEFRVSVDTQFSAGTDQNEFYLSPNETALMEVNATSNAPERITYQWYAMEKFEEEGNNYWREKIIEGATTNSLVSAPITEYTQYLCRVNDGFGNTRNIWFALYIDTHFSVRSEKYEFKVAIGETATLVTIASSDDPEKITYEWFTVDENWNRKKIEGATNSSYTTEPITKRQRYECRVHDGYGAEKSCEFTVTIDYTSQIPTLAQPLALNTPTDAVIEGDCEYAFYYFIPEETDEYILSSFCTNDDTYVHLYNSSLEEINYDDDGGEGTNFHLEATLTAGETYYYGVRFYSRYSGTIPILLVRSNHLRAYAEEYSVRVPYGETATLSVTAEATDTSMITYRWEQLLTIVHSDDYGNSWTSQDWVEIEGETGSSFTTQAVTEAGRYRCTVEDGYGGHVEVWFNVSVETHFEARAAQSQLEVPEGTTAELEVIASSDQPDRITYTWYKAYKYYYSDTDWGWSWSYDGIISGETSKTLITPEIHESQTFVCIVSDGYGAQQQIWFYVLVDTGFRVWYEKNQFSVAPGTELTLEAFAESNYPERISFQWYEYIDGECVLLEGETASTFATGPITAARILDCRVQDGYGSEIGLTYYIAVETHLTAYAKEREITVPLNGTTTLQVIADSDFPDAISYEWFDDQGNTIDGESGPTLTVGPITHESWYRCQVTDGYGAGVSVTFNVRIDTGFFAQAKESPIYVAPGEKVELEVIYGTDFPESISFEWYKGVKEQLAPDHWEWWDATLLEGENGSVLTTEGINEESHYYCVVSDGYNDPVWIVFEIYVDSGFSVPLEEETLTIFVPYGETAQLSVPFVSKYPDQVKFKWFTGPLVSYMGNYWLDNLNEIDGATTNTLTTDPVTGPIGYECVVDDGFGVTAVIRFFVFVQTNFTARAEQETIYASVGDSVTPRIIASSDEPEKITYQWFEIFSSNQSMELDREYENYIDGATGAELPMPRVDGYHKLSCRVSDGRGYSERIVIEVIVQNHFGAEAVNPKNFIGVNDTVELQLNVHGDDLTDLTYAWYRWSFVGMGMGYYTYVRIDGADDSSLLATTEYIHYCCVVTDRFGTPVRVYFDVWQGEEPEGYIVTVTDYTKGKATLDGIEDGALCSGEVTFTVSCDKTALVAVKNPDGFTLLKCTTENGEHRFTLTVTEDTEIVVAIRGDTNLNGNLEMRDATLVSQVKSGAYSNGDGLSSLTADINGNGRVETRDATLICQARNGAYNVQW